LRLSLSVYALRRWVTGGAARRSALSLVAALLALTLAGSIDPAAPQEEAPAGALSDTTAGALADTTLGAAAPADTTGIAPQDTLGAATLGATAPAPADTAAPASPDTLAPAPPDTSAVPARPLGAAPSDSLEEKRPDESSGASSEEAEGEPEPDGPRSRLWDYYPENEFLSPALLHNGLLADSLSWAIWQGLPPPPALPADSLEAGGEEEVEEEFAPVTNRLQEGLPNLSFRPSHLMLALRTDPRRRFLIYDFDSGRVRRGYSLNEDEIGPGGSLSLSQFSSSTTRANLRRVWVDESLANLKASDAFRGRDTASNIRLELPVDLPPAIESIFGPGAPQLTVRGSERITMSGTRRWNVGQAKTEYGSPSAFPQLDMKQDLNVTLTGTVGEKLHIDVAQNSNAPTALDNSIKLRYEGYDDEIIQRVDLGNTSLQLPGTRYVSYGGQHTGLFGINTKAQLGALEINAIASKEEAEAESRSFSGQSSTSSNRINDWEFVKNQFFFFDDPDGLRPRIDLSSVQVWIDDRDLNNNNTEPTVVWPNPTFATLSGDSTDAVRIPQGSYHRLELNADFTLERELYFGHTILALRRPLRDTDPSEVLAVAYIESLFVGQTFTGLDTVGTLNPGPSDLLYLKALKPPEDILNQTNLSEGPWAPARKLALRNVYYLRGENIDLESLEIRIRRDEGNIQPASLGETPYLRIVGLDRLAYTGTQYIFGHDDKVDWDRVNLGSGYLVLPDLRPFAPDQADIQRMGGTDIALAEREALLTAEENQNADIYDLPTSMIRPELHSEYYFEVTFRSRATSFNLPNAMNIIPGSVVVTKNDVPLPSSSLRVDYDLGTVEVLEEIDSTDRINISYQYAPLFALGQKTLAGVGARYVSGPDLSIGTTWLYQAKGSPERRVRLDQEPIKTIVGDVNLSLKKEPEFLTNWVDALPLVTASDKSALTLDAEVGLSFPNPNTRNEVYLDDFEGIEQNDVLSLLRSSWRPSSIPATLPVGQEWQNRRGRLWWYDPRTIHEIDLQPTLSEAEGNDIRPALVMQFEPDGEEGPAEESWASLVQPLSRSGTDLSRHQFLDIWVSDGKGWDRRHERVGKIKIDLGRVSEDAVWDRKWPNPDPPNGVLDTEDQDPPGDIAANNIFDQTTEDTGLDGEMDEPNDDSKDDYEPPEEPTTATAEQWSKINGTEGNRLWDTEDLNATSFLDTQNEYFEFTIDLADTTYLVTDVSRDFAGVLPAEQAANNGWRRYRIPLSDVSVDTVNAPQWQTIRHARIWLTGFPSFQQVTLGGVQILGNRWLERPISRVTGGQVRQDSLAVAEDFLVSGINNKENSEAYTPPIELRRQDNVPEKEQSIWLEVRSFQAGHQGTAYRRYLDAQDFTLYDSMKFFMRRGRGEETSPDLDFFVRFARDTLNYYEYRIAAPHQWKSVAVPLAALSTLKTQGPDSLGFVVAPQPDGSVLSVRGTPSFTQIREIQIGVQNRSGLFVDYGSVWMDELRLSDVKKNVGSARRIAARVKFSDLLDVSTLYESRAADFLQIGNTRGSGTNSEDLGVSTSLKADKFLTPLRLNVPVNFSWQRNTQSPKFQTGNDIEFRDQARDRNVSEREGRKVEVRVSRQASENPWLRYTVDGLSFGFSTTQDRSSQPTRRDTTQTVTRNVNYSASLAAVPPLRLPRGLSLRYTPTNINIGAVNTSQDQKHHARRNDDLNQPFELRTKTDLESSFMNISTVYSPLQFGQQQPLSYSYTSQRDLNLWDQRFFGLRFGKETRRQERLSANGSFDALDGWIAPSVNWEGGFSGDHPLSLRRPGDAPGRDMWDLENSSRTTFNMRFPTSRLLPPPPARGAQPPPSPDDTTGARPAGPSINPLQQLARIVRFNDVSGTMTFGKTSDFSRVYGEPSLAYRLGLTRDRGDRSVASQHVEIFGDSKSLSAQGSLTLLNSVSVDGRYDRSNVKSRRDNTMTTTYQRKWPDLKFDWGTLVSRIKLGGLVKSMSASTRYQRTLDRSGQPNSIRTTEQGNWNPLVQWNATWRNGLATTMSLNTQSSRTETESGLNKSLQDYSRQTLSLSMRQNINATKGISLPFGKKQLRMKSNIDLTLKIDYARSNREARDVGGSVRTTEDRSDATIALNAGYNFSKSVSGNAGVNFGQISDKIRGQTTRSVGLIVSAGFNF